MLHITFTYSLLHINNTRLHPFKNASFIFTVCNLGNVRNFGLPFWISRNNLDPSSQDSKFPNKKPKVTVTTSGLSH